MNKVVASFCAAALIAIIAQSGDELFRPAAAETIPSHAIYMIDGDTAEIDGIRYRLVGYDTPETYQAQCEFERTWGNQATSRARQLVAAAGAINLSVLPGKDRYGRGLARISVSGTDLGDILIAENLARPYDGGRRAGWCE